jgi:hypothetical protein
MDQIGLFNLLRSFFHIYDVPDEIINLIFSLVGKNGFQFFCPDFYVEVLGQPKRVSQVRYPGPYHICMGLKNTKLNGNQELVPMLTLNLVYCRARQCRTRMLEYGQDEKVDSKVNFAFTDIHSFNPKFVAGELYHCFCCHPNVEFYLRSNFQTLKTISKYIKYLF